MAEEQPAAAVSSLGVRAAPDVVDPQPESVKRAKVTLPPALPSALPAALPAAHSGATGAAPGPAPAVAPAGAAAMAPVPAPAAVPGPAPAPAPAPGRAAAATGSGAAPTVSSAGPWGEEESARLREMVEMEGTGGWENKAQRLGTGRSAKALQTRWLRIAGRPAHGMTDARAGGAAFAVASAAERERAAAQWRAERERKQQQQTEARYAQRPPLVACLFSRNLSSGRFGGQGARRERDEAAAGAEGSGGCGSEAGEGRAPLGGE